VFNHQHSKKQISKQTKNPRFLNLFKNNHVMKNIKDCPTIVELLTKQLPHWYQPSALSEVGLTSFHHVTVKKEKESEKKYCYCFLYTA
jgi:hypothetical protein